jgi:hypothetical protein
MNYVIFRNQIKSDLVEAEEFYFFGTNAEGKYEFTSVKFMAAQFRSMKAARKYMSRIRKNSNVMVYIKEA